MRPSIRQIKQTLGLFLAAIYLCYFVGSHFFVHSHILPNRVVVHSHPYDKASHSHTNLELQTIDELSNYVCNDIEAFDTPEVFFMGSWRYALAIVDAVYMPSVGMSPLRAPPHPVV